ncbi:RAD51-associated protein 2-like isoform X1 [Melanotaenia boesemani]|uniref:RAD51-associated protein 2-like isoform X1 n=1 Tax=Melanotaenia boesemani TaxID=1250792 RepID=UPI001C03B7E1|nr:RAD51-associated protein 2-like isoform X1 [Melanotaenia boesemani]
MPVLTSLPRQLLKTPQQQLHMPVAKSDNQMEVPGEEGDEAGEEEEVERFECHTDNRRNGSVSSDLTCNEVPSFTPAADIIALGCPEQQPNCGSVCDSSEDTHDELKPQSVPPAVPSEGLSSGLNSCSEFEMKEQLDRVLKELHLFFEISKNDFAEDRRSPPEQQSKTPPTFERITVKCPDHLSSPKLGHHRNTSADEADEDLSMEICGGDSGVSLTAVSSDGEQEVPLNRHPYRETSKDTAERHKEPREMEQKGKIWCPSFMCQPLLQQLSHRPPEQLRRLKPLKTCTRPIRVGLSRRAKTKHLHCFHPYKHET